MSNAVIETLNKIRLLENILPIFEDLSNLTTAEQQQLDALIKKVAARAATEPEIKTLIDRYSALKGGAPVTPEAGPEVKKPDEAKVKKFSDLLKKAGAVQSQELPLPPEFDNDKPADNPPADDEVNQDRVKGIGDILNKAIKNNSSATILAALDPTKNGIKRVKEWYAVEEYYFKTYNAKLRDVIKSKTTKGEQLSINDFIRNYKPRPNQIPPI
jgi:hypothetical protein